MMYVMQASSPQFDGTFVVPSFQSNPFTLKWSCYLKSILHTYIENLILPHKLVPSTFNINISLLTNSSLLLLSPFLRFSISVTTVLETLVTQNKSLRFCLDYRMNLKCVKNLVVWIKKR